MVATMVREWREYHWGKFLECLDNKEFAQALQLAQAIQAERDQSIEQQLAQQERPNESNY